MLSGLLDLAVAFPVLLVMMVHYRVTPGVAVLAFPVVVLLALATALGAGLWLSALYVEYRDVRHVVTFMVQIWLFVTPVIYPASTVAPHLARLGLPGWLVGVNPMAGVVEGARWGMLGTPRPQAGLLAASALVAAALCVSGALYFRRVERGFADVV